MQPCVRGQADHPGGQGGVFEGVGPPNRGSRTRGAQRASGNAVFGGGGDTRVWNRLLRENVVKQGNVWVVEYIVGSDQC